MELTGAQILLECLKREGVDVLFGYPGGAIVDIYDELTRHPEIHHYLVPTNRQLFMPLTAMPALPVR